MNQKSPFLINRCLIRLPRAVFTSLPEEARKHLASAHKESLLGVMAILQHAVDRCDEQIESDERKNSGQPPRSIDITD
jgi:hypothetical protein